MATKLFLRQTTLNAIGAFKDMLATAGSSTTQTGVVNTATAGTQIQWTATAGGSVLEWISGRVPAAGFTLAGTMTFSIQALESNMSANCGGRVRVFKRTALAVETEIIGGPWNDGAEFGTSNTQMDWTGTPTSTVFIENDRLIVRYYITNVGTMASGHTCTLHYDGADAGAFDSFFQINENVAFKGDNAYVLTAAVGSFSHNGQAAGVEKGYKVTGGLGSFANNGQTARLLRGYAIDAGLGSFAHNGQSAGLRKTYLPLAAAHGSFALNGQDATLAYTPGAVALVATQAGVEALSQVSPLARASQAGIETLSQSSPFGRASQVGIEALSQNALTAVFSQVGVEVLSNQPLAYTLTAELGSFALSGQTALLKYGRVLRGNHGQIDHPPQSQKLKKGSRVAATFGSFALNGQNARLLAARDLNGAVGSFALDGQVALFVQDYTLGAGLGSFALDGQQAELDYVPGGIPPAEPMVARALVARRQRKHYRMKAEVGFFYLMTMPARLRTSRLLQAAGSQFRLRHKSCKLLMHRRFSAEAKQFKVSGQLIRTAIDLSPELRALLLTAYG